MTFSPCCKFTWPFDLAVYLLSRKLEELDADAFMKDGMDSDSNEDASDAQEESDEEQMTR